MAGAHLTPMVCTVCALTWRPRQASRGVHESVETVVYGIVAEVPTLVRRQLRHQKPNKTPPWTPFGRSQKRLARVSWTTSTA